MHIYAEVFKSQLRNSQADTHTRTHVPTQDAMSADAGGLRGWDAAAASLCLAAIAFGAVADNQLRAYMLLGDGNNMGGGDGARGGGSTGDGGGHQEKKAKKPLVLDTGLWRVCRHPNHLGEQVTPSCTIICTLSCTRTTWAHTRIHKH